MDRSADPAGNSCTRADSASAAAATALHAAASIRQIVTPVSAAPVQGIDTLVSAAGQGTPIVRRKYRS